jgi:hypothetical protein
MTVREKLNLQVFKNGIYFFSKSNFFLCRVNLKYVNCLNVLIPQPRMLIFNDLI